MGGGGWGDSVRTIVALKAVPYAEVMEGVMAGDFQGDIIIHT